MSRVAAAMLGGVAAGFMACGGSGMLAAAQAKREKTQQTSSQKVFDHTFKRFKLGEVINLSQDTAIFRFLMPNEDDEFSLVPCSTLQAQYKAGASQIEDVQRFYTPITPNGEKGYFDILVKKQKKGRMTEHLFAMNPGESLGFRVISYKMQYKAGKFKEVGLIGAGTGITPLLQVIRAAADKEDSTKVTLLFANANEKKILLKGLLDSISERCQRFKPVYIVDALVSQSQQEFNGHVGLIDAAIIRKTMPKPSDDNLVMVCGSDRLMNSLCGVPWQTLKQWSGGNAMQPACSTSNNIAELGGVLATLGYKTEQVYRF